MFRRLLPLCVAMSSLCAQQDGPAVNADAILRDLDQIELKQKQTVLSARQTAINQIRAAAANGATAADLFEKAVEATQFEGTQNKGAAYADWKKAKAPLLRTKEAQSALVLHLRYLALSMERKNADKPDDLVSPSLSYGNDLAVADALFLKLTSPDRTKDQQGLDKEALKLRDELLNKPLTDSIFVKWLQLAPFLPKAEGWELVPGNLSGILEKNVRPVLREQKNAALLPTYELEMKVLADRVTNTHREHDAVTFNTVLLPRIQLARANDMIALGQRNRGIAEIYGMVKKYPQHPDFTKWVGRLRELLTPAKPAAAPAPETTAPAN